MADGRSGDLKIWAVVLVAGAVFLALAVVFGSELLASLAAALAPGMTIKDAVTWSFGVTFVMFILFALVAGDGVIGELPVMLLAFFVFFAIITVLIAWVF